MQPTHQTTAELFPDPIKICDHIGRLKAELKLTRRLLRVAIDARLRQQELARRTPKPEAAHAAC